MKEKKTVSCSLFSRAVCSCQGWKSYSRVSRTTASRRSPYCSEFEDVPSALEQASRETVGVFTTALVPISFISKGMGCFSTAAQITTLI